MRFKITKIGLLNFWLYDEEEYDFYGGNLILRGSNGSGKSVTMQSFIPLILDGNKSPDRLDPFGSKERKIEDYILGDADSVQKEEATSYLYMETLNEKDGKYITIGLGFRGRKGKPTESWGFAIKDGKRIRKDFYLYKDVTNKIPLSKNELKSRLGSINEFTDTTRDYKAMVNRLLFGFPNLDIYDEFIKLLLQLRSNKLSKDYKPTNLINVLNTVLQPLTEEDLRPLSEAIEQMNKTKEQVETLEKNSKSLKDFLKVYRNYNEILLLTKARSYQKVNGEYKELKNVVQNLEIEVKELKETLNQKNERFLKVGDDIAIFSENKRQLDNQDLKNKIESLDELNQSIVFLERKIKEITNNIEHKKEEEIDLHNKINKVENEVYNLKKELEESGIDLKSLSEESYFDEIVFFIDELNEHIDEKISFESIFMSLKRYFDKLQQMIALLEEEEKILLESEDIRVQFERLSKEYKELERDITNKTQNLNESILEWEEDFINKVGHHKELLLDEITKKRIFELMNDYSNQNYEKAKTLYLDYARDLIQDIMSNNLKLENKKNSKKENLNSFELEYQTLKEAKDIELPSLNEETDQILLENHIENIPLYKCIEFKDGIDEKVKNNIESSLLDLNILNAKVIKEEDINKLKDLNCEVLYLTKSTKKKNNLLKYFIVKLNADITIKKEYVEEILESISIDKSDLLWVGENGISKVDVLSSIADKNYIQNYIGYIKRMELKNKKLKELEEKIEVLTKEISNIENLISEGQNKIDTIKGEMFFPSNQIIIGIIEQIKDLELKLNNNDQRQKELEEVLRKFDNTLKNVKDKITEKKQGMYIPLNLNSYKEVSKVVLEMKEDIRKLENIHNSYLMKMEIYYSHKENLDGIISNIEYLSADRNEKEKEYKVNLAARNSINELLETKEYKDQKERLLELEESLRNLNTEKEKLIGDRSKLENDIEHKEIEAKRLSNNFIQKERELAIYKEIFLREYKLHYVYEDEIVDIDKTVKEIIKEGNSKKEVSLREVYDNFLSSYNHYSLELNDYSLRNIRLFADYSTTIEEEKMIYETGIRADITAMYQGFKLNVIELSNRLEDDIENNRLLISKQDRHLFEDILLNTVGDKIRKKIKSSNEWVMKINNIMSDMQNDSALSFKLVWKSISASNEGEIDTKEIVRILNMDPKTLKESDSEKITNHFRSKLKKAEELYQDSYISFYKIIEEVLDYRNWFTFELFYQRKGDTFKALTDKVFSKFSGGERAKSMYIPLFASCYAKFILAREDALRIIALDEAFAGVDEDNIREMFGILKYLDLNFVINSQVLWGDYDTIDDLSICELIRPRNSSVVTVERYRWNGKYKEIINDRREYNKELENA